MSTFAEIAEVFASEIEERDAPLPPSVASLRERRRLARAVRPRRVYRCRRCGEFGHDQRVCSSEARSRMRGTWDDHFDFVRHFFVDQRFVAKRGKWRLDGPDFLVEPQPFNERIDTPGTRRIAVRLSRDDGRHLVGLIEWSEFDFRVVYATPGQRQNLDAVVARAKERFG